MTVIHNCLTNCEAETLNRNKSHDYRLNIHSCDDSQFNCDDGSCQPLQFRCDGGPDCNPDGADELDCNIIRFDRAYIKNIPPLSSDNINVSINIINVTNVAELDGYIKTHLEIKLEWQDSRL